MIKYGPTTICGVVVNWSTKECTDIVQHGRMYLARNTPDHDLVRKNITNFLLKHTDWTIEMINKMLDVNPQ